MSGVGGGERGIVERFLGPEAAAGGMHALLGLSARAHERGTIVRALERQLTRVDGHPQSRTPEADEVRLALHAAAAQLVHQAAYRERSVLSRTGVVAVPRARDRLIELEQDALLTLARYGGWNRRSLHRLTMLAMARGAGLADVARVLGQLSGRRGAGRLGLGGGGAAVAGRRMPVEPVSTAIVEQARGPSGPMVIGAVASGLALVVALALVLVAITSGGRDAGEGVPEASGAEAAAPAPESLPMAAGEELFPWREASEGGAKPEEDAGPRYARLSDAMAALDSAADGLEIDRAEAVRVFRSAFGAVGEGWCNLTDGQRRAVQHDVVEFVYRAVQDPGLVEPVVGAVASGSRALGAGGGEAEVWPATWSVGVLARLAREGDIGARAAREIESALRGAVGSAVAGGFEQGVGAALWALLPSMTDDASPGSHAERWGRWIEAARAGAGGDAQGVLLSALEWVMVAAEEPGESDAALAGVDALTLAVDWGEDSPGRVWLVRMFADDRVSNADLHALTTTLARRSRAPGVDVTMALPVRATGEARGLLRERYATVWGLPTEGPTLDDLADDWRAAMRQAVRGPTETAVDRLAMVIGLSRLNQAAHLRFLGRLDEAGIVIDEYGRPVELELVRWNQRDRGDSIDGSPGIARWAMSYLSAQRDYARRMELLGRAASLSVRHPTDAEVLVTEAFRGTPAQAREAARAALLAQRPSAVLTLAALELAPRIPRTVQNADLIASITATVPVAIDDADWALKVRRVLVQTALEQLAAEGDAGVVDRLAALLGESYEARAMDSASGPASGSAQGVSAERAAALLRARWERLARAGGLGAEGLEVERVLAAHAARMSLAQGPVQAFAAEQAAAFELMAIAVVSERLDRGREVQAVRTRVAAERRGARDILGQILAVERGFCELWAIRLGQEAPWE